MVTDLKWSALLSDCALLSLLSVDFVRGGVIGISKPYKHVSLLDTTTNSHRYEFSALL